MKEKYKPIKNEPDELFRENLENRSFEFDESYWQDAEQRIAAAERSGELRYASHRFFKRYFGWIMLGLVFILGTVEIIILNQNSDHQPSEISKNENVQLPDNTISSRQNDQIIQEKTMNEKVNEKKPIETGKIKTRKHPLLNKALAEAKNRNEKNTNGKNKSRVVQMKNEESAYIKSPDVTQKSPEKNLEEIASATNDQTISDETPEDEKIPVEPNQLNQQQENTVDQTPVDPSSQSAAMAVAGINNDAVVPLTSADSSKLLSATDQSLQSNGLRFYLGLEVGFDHSVPFLSSNENNADMAAQLRNNSETPADFFGGGIIAGVKYHAFHASTGISKYSTGENGDYSISQLFIDSTYTVVIDSGVIDTVWVMDTTENIFGYAGLNQFSYYELPFLVGYTFGKKDWKFNIETGVSFGFLATASGKYPNTDLTGYTTISSGDYKTATVNWILAPSVEYALNEHIYFDLKAMMRFNLKSMTSDPALDQKYKLYGLRVGVNYVFGK